MHSLRHKIAQMLIMGFDGDAIDANSMVSRWISSDGIGGVLLFDYDVRAGRPGKNIGDMAGIQTLTSRLKAFAKQGPWASQPLFVAIDYEGGAVDRLRHVQGTPPTITAEALSALSGQGQVAVMEEMASTLKRLGFNLNFAPVVDLALTRESGIIGKLARSYSEDPIHVRAIAERFSEVFGKQGIASAWKHFPGHGSAVGDTHAGFTDVTDTFHPDELAPYENMTLGDQFPGMIMTAHVINRKLDPEGLPATLSRPILTGLLRKTLGYDGVIISDDLQMRAIANHFSWEEALAMTLNAGADMLIIANQLDSITAPEIIDMVESLVRSGEIPVSRIEEACGRITRLKTSVR